MIGDQLAVNPKLRVAVAPNAEEMITRRLWLDFSLPANADVAGDGKGRMDARQWFRVPVDRDEIDFLIHTRIDQLFKVASQKVLARQAAGLALAS